MYKFITICNRNLISNGLEWSYCYDCNDWLSQVKTHIFAGYTDRSAFFHDACFDYHSTNDRVSRVEHKLKSNILFTHNANI